MDIKLTAFPAENGESILVEIYGSEKVNILIDLGYSATYKKYIKRKLSMLSQGGQKIDLLIITHFDRDHVEGGIEFFNDLLKDKFIDIGEIWINDFLALSSQKFDLKNINSTQELIYDFSNFLVKEYRNNSEENKQTISVGESITLTKLINKLGFDEIVNKSLKNKIVCFDEENDDKSIYLNNEVKLKILSPKNHTLKLLLFNFLKWFEKDRNIYSSVDKKELFELFISNLDDNIKDFANEVLLKVKTSSASEHNDIIESILKNKDVFKDGRLINNSSIAFLLSFNGINIMFPGDLDCKNIIDIVKDERLDLLKVPHHGSRNNINIDFINSVHCNNYLICTDGSGSSKHPDLETLVYIAQKGESNVYVNYPISEFIIDYDVIDLLKKKYNINLATASGDENTCFELILKKGEMILCQEVNF
ncbi:MBL fold metallo-hydrolase [Clostridium sp. YIM B02506]|uniref:MBL fold metallo-hydrolase n=1 Tax=Clostridium sp. YIM B02506 TaxID=2910680 RepID=UPI001EEE64AB|nr:MBL fold metallo-hydrolase [Clostridium sp. YIM B02506]